MAVREVRGVVARYRCGALSKVRLTTERTATLYRAAWSAAFVRLGGRCGLLLSRKPPLSRTSDRQVGRGWGASWEGLAERFIVDDDFHVGLIAAQRA